MVEGGHDADEEAVNFELLPDIDLENDNIDFDKLTPEQQEAIVKLMDNLELGKEAENDNDSQDFEPQQATFCHGRCSDDQVDDIASEINTKTMKWQTKWAAKVFKGKSTTFTENLRQTKQKFK